MLFFGISIGRCPKKKNFLCAPTSDNKTNFFLGQLNGDAELDLLIVKNGKRLGFEIKFSKTPQITRSQHIALKDLKLDSLTIIYPGTKNFTLRDKIEVRGLESFLQIMWDKKLSKL